MKGLFLLALAGIGGYLVYESTKEAQAAEGGGASGPLPPAPGHPCPTYEQVAAFAKASGYDVFYNDVPLSAWKAPKAAYTANANARAFTSVECGFYKWVSFEGAPSQWVKDLATDAELGLFMAKQAGPKIEVNIPAWAPIDMAGAEGFPPELQVPAAGVLGALGDLFKTSGCVSCEGKEE